MSHQGPATVAGPGLWDYSLAVYARDGVAPACLSLQDEAGLDVNLLLLCLWAGLGRGQLLDAGVIDRARAVAGPWQRQVLAPLRAARRHLKASGPAHPGVQALRSQVLAVELAAERLEQAALLGAVADGLGDPPRPDGLECAAANLATLAGLPRPCSPAARLVVLLGDLLAAAAGVPTASALRALTGQGSGRFSVTPA